MLNKYFVVVWLLLGGAYTAAEEEQSPSEPEPINKEESSESGRVGALISEHSEQLALSLEVKPNELVWLKVKYPDQDELVSVLALEQKPRMPQAQGAVLILHDKEQHADWPYLIRPLRMSLPDAGWHTLSVNLPYENSQKYPERSLGAKLNDQITLTEPISLALQLPAVRAKKANKESVEELPVPDAEAQSEATDNASESGNVDIDLAEQQKGKKPTLPYRDRSLLHIKAAMDYLHGEGYQNIVIAGYRTGADLALDHIKPNVPQIPKEGFALVMVDPLLQNDYQTDMAKFFGKNFQAPVLDIVNGANLESRRLANERAVGARIANMSSYHQVSLTTNESGAFQVSLLRRVRYWLGKYAPGMAATKISSRR